MSGRPTGAAGEGRRPSASRTILAYTAEDGRLDAVRQAALDLARRDGSRLILYDVDAAGIFQKPLPTNWSGQGSEREFGDVLGPADLERAGRHAIAAQVSEAREAGVDAWAWLPGDLRARSLADYVHRVGADIVVIPPEMGHPGGPLEDLVRAKPEEIEKGARREGVEVVVVGGKEEGQAEQG
jgi:nucleotide-binding universal stress UspA family protein